MPREAVGQAVDPFVELPFQVRRVSSHTRHSLSGSGRNASSGMSPKNTHATSPRPLEQAVGPLHELVDLLFYAGSVQPPSSGMYFSKPAVGLTSQAATVLEQVHVAEVAPGALQMSFSRPPSPSPARTGRRWPGGRAPPCRSCPRRRRRGRLRGPVVGGMTGRPPEAFLKPGPYLFISPSPSGAKAPGFS